MPPRNMGSDVGSRLTGLDRRSGETHSQISTEERSINVFDLRPQRRETPQAFNGSDRTREGLQAKAWPFKDTVTEYYRKEVNAAKRDGSSMKEGFKATGRSFARIAKWFGIGAAAVLGVPTVVGLGLAAAGVAIGTAPVTVPGYFTYRHFKEHNKMKKEHDEMKKELDALKNKVAGLHEKPRSGYDTPWPRRPGSPDSFAQPLPVGPDGYAQPLARNNYEQPQPAPREQENPLNRLDGYEVSPFPSNEDRSTSRPREILTDPFADRSVSRNSNDDLYVPDAQRRPGLNNQGYQHQVDGFTHTTNGLFT